MKILSCPARLAFTKFVSIGLYANYMICNSLEIDSISKTTFVCVQRLLKTIQPHCCKMQLRYLWSNMVHLNPIFYSRVLVSKSDYLTILP